MFVHTREHNFEKLCHLSNGHHLDFRYPDAHKFSVSKAVRIIKVPLY